MEMMGMSENSTGKEGNEHLYSPTAEITIQYSMNTKV